MIEDRRIYAGYSVSYFRRIVDELTAGYLIIDRLLLDRELSDEGRRILNRVKTRIDWRNHEKAL